MGSFAKETYDNIIEPTNRCHPTCGSFLPNMNLSCLNFYEHESYESCTALFYEYESYESFVSYLE